MFKSEDGYEHEPPDTILILDMDTGNYQVLKTPFYNDKYYSSEYFMLGQSHHRVQTIERISGNKKKEHTIMLHNIDKHRSHTLQTADAFLYKQLDNSDKNSPEFITISYDKQKRQSKFCRLKLRHKHLPDQ